MVLPAEIFGRGKCSRERGPKRAIAQVKGTETSVTGRIKDLHALLENLTPAPAMRTARIRSKALNPRNVS